MGNGSPIDVSAGAEIVAELTAPLDSYSVGEHILYVRVMNVDTLWSLAGAYPFTIEDPDSDGDGTPDSSDQCDNDPAKTEPGQCGCSVADTDSNNDGIADCNDSQIQPNSELFPWNLFMPAILKTSTR